MNVGSKREGRIKLESQPSGVGNWVNIDATHPDKKQTRRRRAVFKKKTFILLCFVFVKGGERY